MQGDPRPGNYGPERRSWNWRPFLSEALWIMGAGAFIAATISAGIFARYWKG